MYVCPARFQSSSFGPDPAYPPISCMRPFLPLTPLPAEQTVQSYESRIFAKADQDGDSAISVKEFPDMASELGVIIQEEGRRRQRPPSPATTT